MPIKLVLSILLITTTLTVFMQTGDHQFINFDDDLYVSNNPHVIGGLTRENIAWAFTSTHAGNWHPLAWLSHLADVDLFGMNPRGHHLTSVFIHSASAFLLFLLLVQFTAALWRSFFVAALFALHPLHVESVAWIAERKDVLSCFFWMLTLLIYSGYVKKPVRSRYLLALFSFVLALMAKPMAVSLPVVLLILDYWPCARLHSEPLSSEFRDSSANTTSFLSLFKEKIPFFFLSACSGIITFYAQKEWSYVVALDSFSFKLRIGNALVAYVKYVRKTIWPHDLAIVYPLPGSLPIWQVGGSLLLLAGISFLACRVRRRFPYLLMGWLWFLVTLLPVIGIIQVGSQAMADRYTYIPIIGLFIMGTWGAADLVKGRPHGKTFLAVLGGAVLFVLVTVTWRQLGTWKDSITLYRSSLAVTCGNYIVHNNLGLALAEGGRLDEAIDQFRAALLIKPNFDRAHYNLGLALSQQGRLDEAIAETWEALQINPDYEDAHSNLGNLLVEKGKVDEAISHYIRALSITSEVSKKFNYTAIALALQVRLDEAVVNFQKALQLNPRFVDARYNLAIVLAQQNKTEEAKHHLQEVLRLMPEHAGAQRLLGIAQKKTQ